MPTPDEQVDIDLAALMVQVKATPVGRTVAFPAAVRSVLETVFASGVAVSKASMMAHLRAYKTAGTPFWER